MTNDKMRPRLLRPRLFSDFSPGVFATVVNDNGRNEIGQWVRGSWRAEYVNFMADFLAQLQLYNNSVEAAYNHAFTLLPADLQGHLKM